MSNLFKKANAPYLIASSLATLTLVSSLVLAVTSNVPLLLILTLTTLSVLVVALSCKMIKNNKKIENDKDKPAKKEQELENKITLAKGVGESTNKQVEKLNSQVHKLTQEKEDLDKKAQRLDLKLNELEAQKDVLSQEKELLERRLEARINYIDELHKMIEKLTKELGHKQQKKELHHNRPKKSRFREIKEMFQGKILRLKKQSQNVKNRLAKKVELEKKISNIKYEEPKNRGLDGREEKLRVELDKLKNENKRLVQENNCIRKELEKAKQDAKADEEEVDNAHRASNNKQAEIQNLQAKLYRQLESIKELESKLDKQTKENEQYVGESEQLVEEYVKGLQELERNKDKEIERLNYRIDSLEKTIRKPIDERNSVSQKPKNAMRLRSVSLPSGGEGADLSFSRALNDLDRYNKSMRSR